MWIPPSLSVSLCNKENKAVKLQCLVVHSHLLVLKDKHVFLWLYSNSGPLPSLAKKWRSLPRAVTIPIIHYLAAHTSTACLRLMGAHLETWQYLLRGLALLNKLEKRQHPLYRVWLDPQPQHIYSLLYPPFWRSPLHREKRGLHSKVCECSILMGMDLPREAAFH